MQPLAIISRRQLRRVMFASSFLITAIFWVTAPAANATCPTQCNNKNCGPDGCGGSCGECLGSEFCNTAFQCEGTCDDWCDELQYECGSDGCGDLCGICFPGQDCVNHKCFGDCAAECDGKECGDDGCGDECGVCATNHQCVEGACDCTPNCSGKNCGDNSCGGNCGTCFANEDCQGGLCVACIPDCVGKQCGLDGCGGECGQCLPGLLCVGHQCSNECSPYCEGIACGDDGCGGECGTCPSGYACADGACICATDCSDKECGDNGCGVTCGECPPGEYCDAWGMCFIGSSASSDSQNNGSTSLLTCPSDEIYNVWADECTLPRSPIPGPPETVEYSCRAGSTSTSLWATTLGFAYLFLSRRRRTYRGCYSQQGLDESQP